jgi:hypothetical protein
MTFKKGAPKPATSGRKPGSVNKRTRALAACEEAGIDPFLYLAKVVANKKAKPERRDACAMELCEYIEPKLSRQEYETGDDSENQGRGFLLIPIARPKK